MTTRRLAAILAADVVGFSSMMERDEEETLAQIRALQGEIVRPAVERHQGRVVKTTGDGFLIEFASPVEAVRCAVGIQDGLISVPFQMRIGINLGDVIIEPDGDVYGDGVNIATRLEGLADPGGICISGAVYDQIEGKIDRQFESRGEQQVKNITKPVRVYALASGSRATMTSRPKPLPLPDKPSIAVLPFTNMSGDAEQEYFADGVVEEIITALSRLRWLFVIARNSSFTYKGKAVDIRQVGRDLGVRYVLEGSIRKAGHQVRITGQLIDASTGQHIWADRIDGSLENIFDLQDRITEEIAGAVEPALRAVEMDHARAKPTESLTAYDLYLRALTEIHVLSKESLFRARGYLESALQRDPNYSDAWASLADCIGRAALPGWIEDIDTACKQACDAATRAVVADPNNGSALALAAWAFAIMAGRVEQAAELASRAVSLAPNSAVALTHCGWAFAYNNESDRAIACLTRARRLDPLDPRRFQGITAHAIALFFARNFEEAIRLARRVTEESPATSSAWRILAAAYAQNGELAEARSTVDRLLTRQPGSSVTRTAITSRFRYSWMVELYLEGLRKAGLPE